MQERERERASECQSELNRKRRESEKKTKTNFDIFYHSSYQGASLTMIDRNQLHLKNFWGQLCPLRRCDAATLRRRDAAYKQYKF